MTTITVKVVTGRPSVSFPGRVVQGREGLGGARVMSHASGTDCALPIFYIQGQHAWPIDESIAARIEGTNNGTKFYRMTHIRQAGRTKTAWHRWRATYSGGSWASGPSTNPEEAYELNERINMMHAANRKAGNTDTGPDHDWLKEQEGAILRGNLLPEELESGMFGRRFEMDGAP